jgi:hypothetical protein
MAIFSIVKVSLLSPWAKRVLIGVINIIATRIEKREVFILLPFI